jgi:hypothetical protein
MCLRTSARTSSVRDSRAADLNTGFVVPSRSTARTVPLPLSPMNSRSPTITCKSRGKHSGVSDVLVTEGLPSMV